MKLNKRSIVFGLGLSGISAITFLLNKGYEVLAADDSQLSLLNLEKNAKSSAKSYSKLTICKNLDDINWSDIGQLILSPGVALTHPKPHKIVQLARQNNCPIIGDVELLYRFNPKTTYIGITGTNGKSTSTALTAHIFQANNIKHQFGGNIGVACLDLPDLGEQSCILEMSSYQLDLIDKTQFHIASLLNITPDHLDRHKDMAGYIAAKKRIFLNQKAGDFALINIDDEHCRKLYENLNNNPNFKAKLIAISTNSIVENGVSIIGDILYENVINQTQYKLPNLPFLKGKHNAQNIAFAFTNALLSGIPALNIINSLTSFKGLAHRMQLIGNIGNINFINDSKATNATSTMQALQAYDNIYWILGGVAKSGGIEDLQPFFKKVKCAFLIGEATEEFAAILSKNQVKFYKCEKLDNAFNKAYEEAKKNSDKSESNILLSPACSSFDQWRNFEERGNYFQQLANNLLTTQS